MNYFYFDSSALVKRYAKEIGARLVGNLCQKEEVAIFISDITLAELGAAFARKLREREITEVEYTVMLGDLQDDYLYEYFKVPINFEVLNLAVSLARKRALRGYDAVQLACAVKVKEAVMTEEHEAKITFIVADKTLEKTARAEGFVTINPNTSDESNLENL
jgi:predicted nucleic acid-binding protein